MPELPEVQVIVDELNEKMPAGEIVKIRFLRNNILKSPVKDFEKLLLHKRFNEVKRIGKYLLFICNGGGLLAHLRMTGKFILTDEKDEIKKYDRLIFDFADGKQIRFNDLRTLGTLEVFFGANIPDKLSSLGVDPLSPDFNHNFLYERLKSSKVPMKNFLMDQRIIAGLGNIYVSEILYRAGISPLRISAKVSAKSSRLLFDCIVNVLREALKKNGTTISDFRSVDDKTGEFQNFLRVYGKEKHPCPTCGQLIKRIVQQQRSTFYCPSCQK